MMSARRVNPIVLSVDGGQSSTLALAADYAGRILGVGRAGPSNHVHEPGGLERLERALRESILGAVEAAGLTAAAVTHICLGLTGGPTEAIALAAQIVGSPILLYQDTVTALYGASIDGTGVIVIAGTGSVAYGRLRSGAEALADGWGYLMGDEGSAYDVGVQALRAAARATDGRSGATLLLTRIPQHFGLPDLRAVHRAVYSQQLDRPQIASLAAVVGAAAFAGDEAARAILTHAGRQLGSAAATVIARLGKREDGLPVYTTGGVFAAGDFVLEPLRQMLAEVSPRSTVQPARYAPVIGGLFAALRMADVEIDSALLSHIEATLPPEAIIKRGR